jgi:N6-adenosine-specific RNA methylase IME4
MKRRKIKIQRSFAKGRQEYETRFAAQPFTTAIIDPDWPYTVAPGMKAFGDVKDAHRKGRLSGFTRNRDSERNQYRRKHPLSIDELKQLPIGDAVAGYIMLWTVGPFLINGAACEILKAWGFEPASIVTWAKYDLRHGHGYGGVGYWFLGNAEFCIVAKRPGFPSIRTGLSSLIVEPKGHHSAKPNSIHSICERRFPGPYLEIFGRRRRPGWLVVGDEAPATAGIDIKVTLGKIRAGQHEVDTEGLDAAGWNKLDTGKNHQAQAKGRAWNSASALWSDDMDGDDVCPRLL